MSQISQHKKSTVVPSRKSEGASDTRTNIVQSLLQEILQGKHMAGERLVTEALAQRFEVSHTPIREALQTLSGMGVVEIAPNRGAVVRRFTTRDVREICQVRRVLECQAVRSACGLIDTRVLLRLRSTFERLSKIQGKVSRRDLMTAQDADTKLHALIRNSARNQFLSSELTRLMTMITVIRDVAWERLVAEKNLARVVEESQQHLEIVDALLKNNPILAARSMSRHIKTGARSIVRAVGA